MAGLSVLLEAQQNFPKNTQILNKTTIVRNSSLSSPSPSPSPSSPPFVSSFLERCHLCRKKLGEGKDIYMYRGDRAFCSEECRCRQIFMDEESGRRDHCSLAAAASSAAVAPAAGVPAGRHRRPGKGRTGAGGFAY